MYHHQNTTHHYERPSTPQTLQHQAPATKPLDLTTTPQKYIVLLQAPTHVAGKLQIATQVSERLSCPLFQGDSLHESCAKAAAVAKSEDGGRARYKRMWFNKMVRTGLLFPESSKPIFDGSAHERRGSDSSMSSFTFSSSIWHENSTDSSSLASSGTDHADKHYSTLKIHVNAPIATHSRMEDLKRDGSPSLLILTHPEMEQWHKDVIRETVQEYGIGVLFVPLYGEVAHENKDHFPILQPLNRSMVQDFQSFEQMRAALARDRDKEYGHGKKADLGQEMVLKVDAAGTVEELTAEIVAGARNVILC